MLRSLACTAVALLLTGSAHAQPLDAEAQRAVIGELDHILDAHYVFPDLGVAAGRHVVQRLAEGAYAEAVAPQDFAERLTADLQDVTTDRHLNVWFVPEEPAPSGDDVEAEEAARQERRRRNAIEQNYGFARVERVEGNVGVLDLRGFFPTEAATPTALAALTLLDGADALVVDLRQNSGGWPDMVRFLLTHLFAERTHLNSLYWRADDHTEEFWTLDERPGPDLSALPVVVLTSADTFSAGEEFAYDLQARGRATIVGETTGGGANPGDVLPLGGRFQAFIPTGRAINPVTQTNWEGVGVVPDVAVAAEDAYERGLEIAREAAQARRDARDG